MQDPLAENYYAFLLAITYPYFLTPDEALSAIENGISPLHITEQTLSDGLRLSKMRKEPRKFAEICGRRYEIVKLISEFIKECDYAMKNLRDYELQKYRIEVINQIKLIAERIEEDRNL